ncbi:MAG TPA: PAS domain S-box protein [Candidatus Rifleibacterium sp.]|nr:PAS domain S-box protein [Candidatus Rifleibacterium sp.]
MLFIFSVQDFEMQYADKEAIAHFRLGEGSSFKLFDIHPDLQIQGFVNEISELSRGRLDRIERILSFGTRDHQMFSGRFIFSLVKLGGHDFIEVVCECSRAKNPETSLEVSDMLVAAQKNLLISERTMATIVDLAVDGVVIIDDQGIIQAFNLAAERMFGYRCSEVLGRNVSLLAPEPHRSKHDGYIKRFLTTRIPHIIGIGREVDAQKKDGELFPIDLAVGEVRLETGSLFTGFIRDLSESRKLISERNSFFQMSLDLFCILGFDGLFRRVNPQWHDVMGYAPEDLQGKPFGDLIHPDDIGSDGQILREILGERNVFGRVMRLRQQNGDWRWLLWNSSVDRANRAIYGVSRDITEQKSMLEELQKAKAEAEKSSMAKGIFIAKMSHEFRTPLNSIIGFSRHLQKNTDNRFSERDMLYLDRILRNGETLLKMIVSILDFSRSESHQLRVESREVNLRELLEEIIDLMQVLIEERHVDIVLSVPEGCRTIFTDVVKLRQILQNLIDNAIKFSDNKPVKIEVVVDEQNQPGQIDVVDAGPGIEADKVDLIFEAFQQADNRIARKYGGAGLGLAIARSFAELLGMKIIAKSEPGHGSCFSVILPKNGEKP